MKLLYLYIFIISTTVVFSTNAIFKIIYDHQAGAYERTKANAIRLGKIKKATTKVSCHVENGVMILELMRHDLSDRLEFSVPGMTSCEIDNDHFEIEFVKKGCGFSWRDGGLGFVAGVASGATVCLLK